MHHESRHRVRGPHSPQRSRKSHAGERRDPIVLESQGPARQHQEGQRTCHLLQRRLTEVCMHHETSHRVSVGICEGHTHDKEAGKVTPASDVIALKDRYRFLRGSTR